MPFSEDKSQILEKYGPYVRSLANGVRKQFNLHDTEDLVSYGTIGLLEAADRFDDKIGANFLTFAHYRIKGAIFDGLRRMNLLKGPEQRSLYISERATSYLASATARDSATPRTFADDVREVESAVTCLATILACSIEATEGLQLRDESPSQHERLELAELKARVRVAIDRLPDNERRLLIAYYYENKTLEEAGAVIGQSKSWSSRLHARAIERLKEFLAEEMALPPESSAPAEVPNKAFPRRAFPEAPVPGGKQPSVSSPRTR